MASENYRKQLDKFNGADDAPDCEKKDRHSVLPIADEIDIPLISSTYSGPSTSTQKIKQCLLYWEGTESSSSYKTTTSSTTLLSEAESPSSSDTHSTAPRFTQESTERKDLFANVLTHAFFMPFESSSSSVDSPSSTDSSEESGSSSLSSSELDELVESSRYPTI